MILSNFQQTIIGSQTLLGAAENRVLPVAMENAPGSLISGVDHMWCHFGVIGQLAFTFSCEVSGLGSFGTFDTLFALAVPAATYTTQAALPAPVGDTGAVALTGAFIRFRANNAGAAMTYTRIFIRCWAP